MQSGNHSNLYIVLLLLSLFCSQVVNASDTPEKIAGNIIQRATSVDAAIQREGMLHEHIIDTRPLSSCQNSSLDGATCLPVEDVLAPNRRVANWSGILWLLGTANLTGNEHVIVVGQIADRRDFIAGLLLLAGQHRITVVEKPVSEFIGDNIPKAGSTRATTRAQVYTAQMRSEFIILRNELSEFINSNQILLDGRTESEYYGSIVRSERGGHIPGAILSPLSGWRNKPLESGATYKSLTPIAYAHDIFDTMVYLTALHTAGVAAKVYLAGWVEWAATGTLPVDSVSYPRIATTETANPAPASIPARSSASMHISRTDFVIGAAFVFCMIVASFFTGRQFSGKRA